MKRDEFTIGRLARDRLQATDDPLLPRDRPDAPAALRTAGNQRRYGPGHVARLAFIRHGRELGFPLDAIRTFLSLADDPDRPCEAADRIARAQLEAVECRIVRINSLKLELERMIEQYKGGPIAECRVIEGLADHTECLHENHIAPA